MSNYYLIEISIDDTHGIVRRAPNMTDAVGIASNLLQAEGIAGPAEIVLIHERTNCPEFKRRITKHEATTGALLNF